MKMRLRFWFLIFKSGDEQMRREEGKNGRGGVFVTPTEVELAKMVHACHATSTVEILPETFA